MLLNIENTGGAGRGMAIGVYEDFNESMDTLHFIRFHSINKRVAG